MHSNSGHVFGRSSVGGRLPEIARGEGCYLYDSTGKQYLDGSGGAAVSCLGHSDAAVTAAIHKQLDTIAFAHTGFFTSAPAEALAEELVKNAPGNMDRVFMVSGGSEAVESALKLARQYYVEIGQPERHRIIARRQSFHGNTIAALATGGNAWRRTQFAPLMIETSHIAPCFEYRDRDLAETEQEFGLRVADELETEIERLGPENVMAFVAEPVVGATLGAVPAVDGYFRRVREICDKHGVLLILDEVMCGMGRTGSLFAYEQESITPDIVTIAKGLGAGYQPIGATMCTAKIHDAIAGGSGFFQHSHTYMGHPTAAAAALAVIDRLVADDLVSEVTPKGAKLDAALRVEFGDHPHVGDIRGRGLFRGLEFVADREAKATFDPELKLAARFKAAAMDAGLVCYPMAGTIDGKRGDHVLLAPPFIIEDDQIDELVGKLATALETVLSA